MTDTDPHDKAMLGAEAAFAARKAGLDEATGRFAEAMRLEAQAGLALPPDPASEPSRSVLLRSAATLALHAAQPQEAIRLATAGLAGSPPAAIQIELGEVLDEATARAGRQPVRLADPWADGRPGGRSGRVEVVDA